MNRLHPQAENLRRLAVAQHGEAAMAKAETDAARMREREALETPEARKTRIAHEAREADHKRVSEYVRALKMPVRGELLEDIVRGQWEDTDARQKVSAWLKSEHRILALLGDIGTGKTTAVTRAACFFAKERRSVAYIRESDLVRLTQGRTLVAEEKLERLRDVDLLVVDELGTAAVRDGNASMDAILNMVDHRIAGEVRTILIGNFSGVKELVATYGSRFADRLRENGTVAQVEGGSMRGDVRAPKTEAGRKARKRLNVSRKESAQ